MRFSLEGAEDAESMDLLAELTDPSGVQLDITADDESDPQTEAAERILGLIDSAYAEGKPKKRIDCPFCGRPLRYRKDENGRLADCPGGDFVCIG